MIRIGPGTGFTGDCRIYIRKLLIVWENCLISWDTKIMDNGVHSLILAGMQRNEYEPIKIGDHCWVGSHCLISKGTELPDNTVVASGSHINKKIKKSLCDYRLVGLCIKRIS